MAAEIGVTTSTVWNWEHGWSVDRRFLPLLIAFLGYNPILCPDDVVDRLAWYKRVNGLTFEELGTEMGRDLEQLADWLGGRHRPCRRNREAIEQFLKDLPLFSEQIQKIKKQQI